MGKLQRVANEVSYIPFNEEIFDEQQSNDILAEIIEHNGKFCIKVTLKNQVHYY